MATKTQPDLASMIAQAVAAALADLTGDSSHDETPETPTKGKARKTPGGVGRESRFTPSAVKRLSIPRRKGASFTYAGKRGTTHWKVTEVNADGSVTAQRTK